MLILLRINNKVCSYHRDNTIVLVGRSLWLTPKGSKPYCAAMQ